MRSEDEFSDVQRAGIAAIIRRNSGTGHFSNSSNNLQTLLQNPSHLGSQRPVEAHRGRSGSFNPNILASTHSPETYELNRERTHSRERSNSDVRSLQLPPIQNLLRPRTESSASGGSDDHCSVDFVKVECFFPTGMIKDVSVHPDESIFQIKQIMLNAATSDEDFPLRGCLNLDFNSYYVTYVSQQGCIGKRIF